MCCHALRLYVLRLSLLLSPPVLNRSLTQAHVDVRVSSHISSAAHHLLRPGALRPLLGHLCVLRGLVLAAARLALALALAAAGGRLALALVGGRLGGARLLVL